MILTKPVYFIMWKERPIQFLTDGHTPTDYFEDAAPYGSKKEADFIVSTLDEPDQFDVIEGKFEVNI